EGADKTVRLADNLMGLAAVLAGVELIIADVELDLAAVYPAQAVLIGGEGERSGDRAAKQARDRPRHRRHIAKRDRVGGHTDVGAATVVDGTTVRRRGRPGLRLRSPASRRLGRPCDSAGRRRIGVRADAGRSGLLRRSLLLQRR